MSYSICGVNCEDCRFNGQCGGCSATGGRPFGGECPLALCCKAEGHSLCSECGRRCAYTDELCAEINALGIKGLPEVKELFALSGVFVNMRFDLPNGQSVKLLEDDTIYLGTQLPKEGTELCFGIAANRKIILVCEYAEGGAFPEIVLYKRRDGK